MYIDVSPVCRRCSTFCVRACVRVCVVLGSSDAGAEKGIPEYIDGITAQNAQRFGYMTKNDPTRRGPNVVLRGIDATQFLLQAGRGRGQLWPLTAS
eukprot:scaffold4060_cov190-Amphora_coffeaeformis.AAC.14